MMDISRKSLKVTVDDLSPILQYGMTRHEAKAFQVALIYERLGQRMFEGMNIGRLPQKGDPRRGDLFKHCYKLVRDTEATLPTGGYYLYVLAQFQVIKSNADEQGAHGLIKPSCLVGERAWKRWLLFSGRIRRAQRQAAQSSQAKPLPQSIAFSPLSHCTTSAFVAQMKATRRFLDKALHGYDPAKVRDAAADGRLTRWARSGRVPTSYLALAQKSLGVDLSETIEAAGGDPILPAESPDDHYREIFSTS